MFFHRRRCPSWGQMERESLLLKAIMAAQPPYAGRITFEGKEIQALRTEDIVRMGVIYVPEDRRLFSPCPWRRTSSWALTLWGMKIENRRIWSLSTSCFRSWAPRNATRVATMSGGEQQMVAIGRGSMSSPKVLMLDEPSLGLAPVLVDEVLDTVRRLKEQGLTILLVEQNVREARNSRIGRTLYRPEGSPGRDPHRTCWSDEIRKAFLGM